MNFKDLLAKGGNVTLPAGEFEGPVVIDRPLHLKGNNTTIWAKNGAVIDVISNGAVLENIRVEITEGLLENTAINAEIPTVVKNVEILGAVKGFGSEDGAFDVPRTIELGDFLSDAENTFDLTVNVPAKTEIFCGVSGIGFFPKVLKAGRNELVITVSGISPQTLLYAEILFKSKFIRRVYLCGRSKQNVDRVSDKRIYTAPELGAPAPSQRAPEVCDVLSVENAPRFSSGTVEMKRGMRLLISRYISMKFDVFFSCEMPRGMEIDPYVFLLSDNDKSLGDEGLIFFGNERSENGEAVYFPKDGHVELDLAKVDRRVKKISLVYSIYAGSSSYSFSTVKNCRVSIRSEGSERISYPIAELGRETTVVALEFYLYKGEWKISAVGAGYNDGMAKLCGYYGIEVET